MPKDNAATEECQSVARVLRNTTKQRQDDLSQSCGGGQGYDAMMARFGA